MDAKTLAEKIFAMKFTYRTTVPEIEALLTEFHDGIVMQFGKRYQDTKDECMRFAQKEVQIKVLEAIAQERAECAKVADHHDCQASCKDLGLGPMCTDTIAAQIRARGGK